jgi:hypothetical protein
LRVLRSNDKRAIALDHPIDIEVVEARIQRPLSSAIASSGPWIAPPCSNEVVDLDELDVLSTPVVIVVGRVNVHC